MFFDVGTVIVHRVSVEPNLFPEVLLTTYDNEMSAAVPTHVEGYQIG